MDATEATPIPAPGVERKIGLAWVALAWEGIWPRLMPLLAMVALFIAAAHLDLFGGLDPWVHTGILAGSGAGLHRPRLVALPDFHLADPRRGHPPARAGLAACRIGRWSRSRTRWRPAAATAWSRPCGRRIAAARPSGSPASATGRRVRASPKFDTWALRLVPLLALVVAVAVGRRLARRSHGGRLHAGLPAAAAGRRQSLDRAAGLYRQAADLSRHGRARQAPARAGRQQARGLRRRRARPPSAQAGDRRQGDRVQHRQPRASTRSRRSSTRASKITLQARGDEQARWKLHVIPDLAPTIEFSKPIGVDKWSTKIDYIAGDDFGVTGVQLQMRLHGSHARRRHADDGEEPEVLRVDLPVAGQQQEGEPTPSCATSPAIRGPA